MSYLTCPVKVHYAWLGKGFFDQMVAKGLALSTRMGKWMQECSNPLLDVGTNNKAGRSSRHRRLTEHKCCQRELG